MSATEENIIPENAHGLLIEARARAGEYIPGCQVKVQFSGAFHDGESFDERHDMRDGKLRRRRGFTVTFPASAAEQFLLEPSLDLIFDQYGLPLDWLVALEVDNITIEQVPVPQL